MDNLTPVVQDFMQKIAASPRPADSLGTGHRFAYVMFSHTRTIANDAVKQGYCYWDEDKRWLFLTEEGAALARLLRV